MTLAEVHTMFILETATNSALKHISGQLCVTPFIFTPKMITPNGKDGSVKLKILPGWFKPSLR